MTRSVVGDDDAARDLDPPLSEPAQRELAGITDSGLWGQTARAELLARDGRAAEAAGRYREIQKTFPEARELALTRLFVLDEAVARRRKPAPDPTIGGKTYALLIGISSFQNAQIRPLRYAHEDALLFEKFLRSPRGGGLNADDITLLTDRQATTAAIKASFETILKKATSKDTVVLLLATHGAVIETGRHKGGYIVSYDADPEDLASTGLPMAAIQRFIRDELGKTARVLAFIDACRSGTIGTIPERAKLRINAEIDALAQSDTQLLLFTASRPGEVSFEGRQYGGGHGAFSFFLLEAMNGAADFDADQKVTVNEMVSYVQQKVAEATVDKQHPREGGTLDATVRVADTSRPGIEIGTYQPGQANAAESTRAASAGAPAVRVLNLRQAVDFDAALSAGRILPDEPANAFTAFRQLKLGRKLTRDQVLEAEMRLRTALEDRNQQTLLRYLKGDANPATRADYEAAARAISAAIQVHGETPALAARLTFAEGRIAILDKKFDLARQLLENALRLDPEAAYIYNSLGSVYLEQARYDLAEKAFYEAAARAPHWAYPRHNLALSLAHRGSYQDALHLYNAAIKIAPQYAYLIYNQGLVLARLNRAKEAEAAYRRALELSPQMTEAWNALGALREAQGRQADAVALYRKAIGADAKSLEARHNLANLLARREESRDEAIALLRQNAEFDPAFLPSRAVLAQLLARTGDREAAIVEHRALIHLEPKAAWARAELVRLLADSNLIDEARRELAALVSLAPGDPLVEERSGDIEMAAGQSAEAEAHYRAAVRQLVRGEDRRRVENKLQVARKEAIRSVAGVRP